MAAEILTDEDIRALLVAVGADPSVDVAQYQQSFEELDLDSLARTEIASRIQDRFGVRLDDEIPADETPAGVQRHVNARLATAGRGASA